MSFPAVATAALAAGFVTFALVVPLLRLWRRERVFGVVAHRTPDPVGRFVGRAFGFGVLGAVAWSVALLTADPATLGVLPAPAWVGVVGAALGTIGLAIVVIAQAHMGRSWRIGVDERPTGLIASGLYRWVRHPIYTGLLLLLAAMVLLAPSPWTVAGAGWLGTMIALQARIEEVHLDRLHGSAWRAWAARTGRFLPGLGRLRPEGP